MSEKRRSVKEVLVLLGFFIVFGVVFYFYGCDLQADLTEECVEPYVKLEQEAPSAQPLCPSEDVVHLILTPFGPLLMVTDKNTYSEEFHSRELFERFEGWITLEEYAAWVLELEKEQEKKGTI